MLGRDFTFDSQIVHMEFLTYKSDGIEIWFENHTTKEVLDNMPHKELIPQIFEIYKSEKYLEYSYVLIDDNIYLINNWLSEENKTWAVSLRAVIDTMRRILVNKNIDISGFDSYLQLIKYPQPN